VRTREKGTKHEKVGTREMTNEKVFYAKTLRNQIDIGGTEKDLTVMIKKATILRIRMRKKNKIHQRS
jgi:hypothetical protein